MSEFPHILYVLGNSSEVSKSASLLAGHADCNQKNHHYSGEYENPLWQLHSPNFKQELSIAFTVLDYINGKYNKYATREDALETDLLQNPVLWDALFSCCGTN